MRATRVFNDYAHIDLPCTAEPSFPLSSACMPISKRQLSLDSAVLAKCSRLDSDSYPILSSPVPILRGVADGTASSFSFDPLAPPFIPSGDVEGFSAPCPSFPSPSECLPSVDSFPFPSSLTFNPGPGSCDVLCHDVSQEPPFKNLKSVHDTHGVTDSPSWLGFQGDFEPPAKSCKSAHVSHDSRLAVPGGPRGAKRGFHGSVAQPPGDSRHLVVSNISSPSGSSLLSFAHPAGLSPRASGAPSATAAAGDPALVGPATSASVFIARASSPSSSLISSVSTAARPPGPEERARSCPRGQPLEVVRCDTKGGGPVGSEFPAAGGKCVASGRGVVAGPTTSGACAGGATRATPLGGSMRHVSDAQGPLLNPDSLSALDFFRHSPLCHWDLDVSRFRSPVSYQACDIPDVSDLWDLLLAPWGDEFCPCTDLDGIPGLHASALFALRSTPRLSMLPDFVPTTIHLFTDGSFNREPVGLDSADPIAGWAIALLAEDAQGCFAFIGAVGDRVHDHDLLLPDFSHGLSRALGLLHRSPLHAEYQADVYALLWIAQLNSYLKFVLHGDCLCPLLAADRSRSWSSEPVPSFIAGLGLALSRYFQVSFRHVKAHDEMPWNDLVDGIAKHCSRHGAIGRFPERPVTSQLLHRDLSHWLCFAAMPWYDRSAWPTASGHQWIVTHYPPASDAPLADYAPNCPRLWCRGSAAQHNDRHSQYLDFWLQQGYSHFHCRFDW